jgi:hypothetical protein
MTYAESSRAFWLGAIVIAATIALVWALPGHARDLGQWGDYANSAQIKKWFEDLRQPDVPQASCCGEADAYFADSYEVEGDHYVAIITDERDDAPLLRPHLEPGTRVPVPNEKMKWDQGNPTGHGVIFIDANNQHGAGTMHVFCYVAPGGV